MTESSDLVDKEACIWHCFQTYTWENGFNEFTIKFIK